MNSKALFKLFLSWRILLFLFLLLAVPMFTLQFNFVGFGLSNYLKTPQLWAAANFDGEHYLNIAKYGYGFGEQAFFPLYPNLIKWVARLFNNSNEGYIYSALLISNLSFFAGMIGFSKLLKLDFENKVVANAVIMLLLFPTSFYFGSVYTEGLFFALTVWSFYFARREKWLLAGITGGFAALTRFLGVILFPVLLIELFQKDKKIVLTKVIPLFLILIGLLIYSRYLNYLVKDPLAFFNTLSGFGEQRQSTPVILPQVFYRYLFKVLPSVHYSYFPSVFTAYLEIVVATLFGLLGFVGIFSWLKKIKKIEFRLSYLVYFWLMYLVPTLTGSFSSLPRYVLVIFPAFILTSQLLVKIPVKFRYAVFTFLLVLLFISTSLFVRGYWVS